MNDEKRERIFNIASDTVKFSILFLLAVTALIMIIAMFDKNTVSEAPIGSFDSTELRSGWSMTYEGDSREVTLPAAVSSSTGDEIILSRTLPEGLNDGMSLMARGSMQNVSIFIGGELRESYSSSTSDDLSYFLPSAYVVTQIGSADSGKKITIHLTVKNKGTLNTVSIGYGNNVWFGVIGDALAVNIIAVILLFCGIVTAAAVRLLGWNERTEAAGWLSLLITDVALWIISESQIRQLIFSRPSMSQFFSYLAFDLMIPFACLYFDAVQHKIYHRRYLVIEVAALIETIVSILLSLSGIAEMFVTLRIMHVIAFVSIIIVVVNIVTDVIKKRIVSYRISVVGALIFVVMSLIELAGFYSPKTVMFGVYLCIGLVGLLGATLLQALRDVSEDRRKREESRMAMTINTIETIAGAIDARDEYTGGHSERVGLYAGRLAREMAAVYDLTEDDILRIRYIGLVHDIGKIGVADGVLNKSGRLSDEEFTLMKKHTEIGYEIMASLGGEVEGMLDGIRYHHERFDGKGYPDGLSGTDIPLVARMLALADSYDAMTSNRVYRKRLSPDEVRDELVRCSGTQFDPALTEIFVSLIDRGELSADIRDGKATDSEGRIRSSSALENRLSSDLLENVSILNPSHIRMLCYILKLMEKKEMEYRVLMFDAGDVDSGRIKRLEDAIKEQIRGHDINVKYTDSSNVAAFFDRTREETDRIIDRIKENCGADMTVSEF